MSQLSGKVALVTGASKGIGAAIAEALAAAGAAVAVNYSSSREGAEAVVSRIAAKGGRAVAVGGDVAKSADVKRIFADTTGALGRVDILVNNAGVYRMMPLAEVTEEEFHRQFNINVFGLLAASQAAAAQFGPEGGSIINISSIVTRITPPTSAIYSGTKGAVDAITRTLAKELGPNKVRVNSINPGLVVTEGTNAAGIIGSDFEKGAAASSPLGRVGQVDDIASVAVFLASDAAKWITGEIVNASGGV
ncbi:glucose 1-dehydrogenase [Rhizosaccharibacter radicis]|uniref:Glucose 1-dehydrogenase n=1 Tax=Rhizosaccharibacter radicis TaxID=2782605 RepID=A0ABT1VV06_9PROT|nr:glucose 1-dehydrogenase [Acetobacteraceae bacterium KSS12]